MENYIIKPAVFFEKDVIEYFHPSGGALPGFPLQWDCMSAVRILPAELSVWAGINGHGKSMIVSMIALMAAQYGERTVIASFEMSAKKTLGRMVRQALGKPHPSPDEIRDCLAWLSNYVYIYDYVGRGDVDYLRNNFRIACETEGASQFIIDSLMKCGLAEDNYSGQKFLVENFHNDAIQFNAHVHLITHARKTKDESDKPGKMDVAGAAGITNIADNVYTVWRNKPKEHKVKECERKHVPFPPDLLDQPDCIVECVKAREQGGDIERQYYLWYNPLTSQYTDYGAEPFNFMSNSVDNPF